MTQTNALPEGPYKAYDVLTNEFLGGFDAMYKAYDYYTGRQITVIYRPSKRRKKARSFP
jgi:hypothetical protein